LQVLTGKKPSITLLPLPAAFDFWPLKNEAVTSLIEEKDGGFWIGTIKGLVHLFPDGNYYVYNEKDGLPSSMITTLYRDTENNLWIGTALGLAKWVSKNNVVFYNAEHKEFRNDVYSIFPLSKNNLILSTDHGLQHLALDTKQFGDVKNMDQSYPVAINGSFPFTVHSGDHLGIFDTMRNMVAPIRKLDTVLTGITFTGKHPDGTIFLGTYSGLFAVNKTRVKKF
jgi:ligand-binding sensor domain-containing protein